jgi:5-methyltetrahydropteroyltriglutamate--homocysteine methyltransferase
MQRELPPFRADHVGSLLRPEPLKEARARHAAGQMSAGELKAVEDAQIAHFEFLKATPNARRSRADL